jgi:hypothetical protein
MANTYIIELFTWKNTESVYEKKDDCLMILNLSGKQMGYLTIKSDNKELEYMTVDILNENLVILSREKHNVMSMWNVINNSQVIDYEMYYNGTKFGIRFDTRSSAAEKNFLTEFNKLRKAVQFIESYPSGNKKIEGMKTDDGYNGYCIEYYDNVNSPIKYMGEFEDGEYDGVGEFFSEDSNIRLICGTICNGVPNGHGKLIIGKNKIVQNVDMKKIKYLANSPSYTNQICMDLFPEYNDLIEQVNFEAMGSVDDKLIYLLKKLQMLSSTNMKKTQKDIGTFDSVTKTLSHMFSN